MRLQTKLKTEPGVLEVTPFIDVVFMLLIFFVICTDFVQQPGIKVALPTTEHAIGRVTAPKFILSVTAAGRIFLNDQAVEMEDLGAELGKLFQNSKRHGGMMIVIRADRNIPHGQVAEIMAVARSHNIETCLAIQEQPKNKPSGQFLPLHNNTE